MQATFDLAQVRVGQPRLLRELAERKIGQLASPTDEVAQRLHLGIPRLVHLHTVCTARSLGPGPYDSPIRCAWAGRGSAGPEWARPTAVPLQEMILRSLQQRLDQGDYPRTSHRGAVG